MKCYNCGNQLPPTGGHCPKCGQAVYTHFGAPGAAKGRRLDGCLAAVDSPKDFRAVPNLAGLPRAVDLRGDCTPVEDQGQIGSCTANAAVGALEFQRRKDGKPAGDLSRLFVYYNSRRMSARDQEDCGASIAQCMAALLAFGTPPERSWPYDPALVMKTPDPNVFQQALGTTPREYAKVEGLEHVKGALARQQPVVFGTSLPQRCFEEAGRTGVMPTPDAAELAEAEQKGGHAMLLVGYDEAPRTFIVRNSWGVQWGNQGYFHMTFDTFQLSRAATTSWILGNLEASGAFRVTRPALVAKPVEGSVKDMASKMREEIRGSLAKDLENTLKDVRNRFTPGR